MLILDILMEELIRHVKLLRDQGYNTDSLVDAVSDQLCGRVKLQPDFEFKFVDQNTLEVRVTYYDVHGYIYHEQELWIRR